MTPAEIWYLLNGYIQQQEAEWQRLRWAVWHTAAFAPKYNLPEFDKFMNPKKRRKKSIQEAKRDFEYLTQRMGG